MNRESGEKACASIIEHTLKDYFASMKEGTAHELFTKFVSGCLEQIVTQYVRRIIFTPHSFTQSMATRLNQDCMYATVVEVHSDALICCEVVNEFVRTVSDFNALGANENTYIA